MRLCLGGWDPTGGKDHSPSTLRVEPDVGLQTQVQKYVCKINVMQWNVAPRVGFEPTTNRLTAIQRPIPTGFVPFHLSPWNLAF
jgi:hypothetical protein